MDAAKNRLTIQAVPIVTKTPIRVYQGQNISVPTTFVHQPLVLSSLGNTCIAVIVANETSIPVTTATARPVRQKTARISPPNNAPLVRPRSENAAFSTNSTFRLR